jgi:hypothetical protein
MYPRVYQQVLHQNLYVLEISPLAKLNLRLYRYIAPLQKKRGHPLQNVRGRPLQQRYRMGSDQLPNIAHQVSN